MAPKTEERWKMKICLAGEAAVGKTSLIRRYVFDEFEDKYTVTLGAKVTRKSLTLEDAKGRGTAHIDIAIWDVMGEKFLRELLREAYFYGAQGILAVCDTTRADTLEDLGSWKTSIEKVAGKIPMILLANKVDLKEETVVDEATLQAFTEGWDSTYLLTSAKTGKNVEKAFEQLAQMVLDSVAVKA
ncbi:MAG: Rab family GTPase [Thermoplasmata archaeon]